jgi:hypothetical protein
MSNAEIERATTSTADMVAAGLEQHARAITARVVQLLAEDRRSFLDDLGRLNEMVSAVAIQQAEGVTEARRRDVELLAGIQGVSLQLSEYEALVPPAERVKIAEMVHRHEIDIQAIRARLHGA